MSLRSYIRQWVLQEPRAAVGQTQEYFNPNRMVKQEVDDDEPPQEGASFTISKAENGRILRVRSFDKRKGEWVYRAYVVKADESVLDQVAAAFATIKMEDK